MLDNTTDDYIQLDETGLSQRARELIVIGRVGIAQGDAEALEAYFDPDFRFHGPGGALLGREELWAFFDAYRSALDNFTVERRAIIDHGGDYMSSRTHFAGIFARPLENGPGAAVEPTGEPFDFEVINIFRLGGDNRLLEEWALYDQLAVMAKLGLDVGEAAAAVG